MNFIEERRKLADQLFVAFRGNDLLRPAELLADFESKVRLEEAKWWFANCWGITDWQKVIDNPNGYDAEVVSDAKRIAELERT